ncbi:MAG: DUF488 domain-containing protein [Rhizobacter sp.]|nr:DUF488 domain-containing protein [Chlorobiales bacterium]
MFYRRKVILALLQAFGGELEKISLQKLLFLFAVRQEKRVYEFVPHHYGCYSFSAKADMKAMVARESLTETDTHVQKKDRTNFIALLTTADKKILIEIKSQHARKSPQDLMRLTYLAYPYYAVKSKKRGEILNAEEQAEVEKAKPANGRTVLYTIGYEGVSLEAYLNKLIVNDVKLLVDVRNNPLSMKFGFSKTQLQGYCEKVNVEYLHIPEVGIVSKFRKALSTSADYDLLFNRYQATTLQETVSHQERILKILEEKKRIALTCFEANISQCHRKHLAEKIMQLPNWKYELKHI